MCARQNLFAIFSNHILTLLTQTDVIEGASFFIFLLVDKDLVAEPTLFAVLVICVFITVLSCMVWLHPASMAKVLLAAAASDSVPTHVNRSSR